MAVKILPDGRKIVGIIEEPQPKPKKIKKEKPEDTQKEQA